jgi:hypothetical protein
MAATMLDEHTQTLPISAATLTRQEPGRRTDPLLPAPALSLARLTLGSQLAGDPHTSPKRKRGTIESAASNSSADRLRAQLPAFAPLLEELEIAGWSSTRSRAGGNFHDWLLLGSDRLLVMVGHADGPESSDPTEPALVAQAAWTAIRAHALHTRDAGKLLSLAGQSLWPAPPASVHAHLAVAMIDTLEGHASLAIAGDCLAWKIRAATSEQLEVHQPALGAAAECTYLAHSVELALRERLILVADNPHHRPPKLAASIAATFAHLDAETHRRMLAADAVTLLRHHYESSGPRTPASIAAVRRR